METAQSRCNVINPDTIDMHAARVFGIGGLHFNSSPVFDQLLTAAGVLPERLQDWDIYSGWPAEGTERKPESVVVVPVTVTAKLEDLYYYDPKMFSERAADVVIRTAFDKVARYERQQALEGKGRLVGFLALVKGKPPEQVARERIIQSRGQYPGLHHDLAGVILPHMVSRPRPDVAA